MDPGSYSFPTIRLTLFLCLLLILSTKTNHARCYKYLPGNAPIGSISGTIRTKNGIALPLAKLDLVLNDYVIRTVETDSEGYYAFKGLEAGMYRIQVSAAAYKTTVSSPILVDKDHDLEICDLSVGSLHPVRYRLSYKNDLNCADTPLVKQVDSILVLKSKREMIVFNSRKVLKVYHVSLGRVPVGAKHFKMDYKTPEGIYHINDKNPNSECHKNLGISYPSDADRQYARSKGFSTGGDVKIHGIINGYEGPKEEYQTWDWTYGCIAVLDEEMDELYTHVPVGTVINILP